MEKKANAKIMEYVNGMQINIITKIREGIDNDDIIQYIQQYPQFSLETEDFTKRLEQDIINQPQYWLWSHKRWKHK